MTNEELVYLYQNGDKQALETLIEQNKGIIYRLTNKFYVGGINSVDREDLQQEGTIGLITAAQKYNFDIEHPCKFITYAVYWVYQKMNRYIAFRNTNDEISLNTPMGDDGDTELMDFIEGMDYSFENAEEKIYRVQLQKELETTMREYLTLREREIVELYYGWDNNKCLTYEEIGGLFAVTKERVRQIEDKSLRKLRYSKWGRLKFKEIYTEKKKQTMYSIPGTVESISFAERYLCDEVI